MKNYVIKKCSDCGSLIRVFNNCPCSTCSISCCGKEMEEVLSNSVECDSSKHIPTYQLEGDHIIVMVPHVMEEEHYIEWVSFVRDNKETTVYLKPGDNNGEIVFPYSKGTLYSYCNKHGLWKSEVE